MTPSIDQRSAARILDLAESRGSRSSALVGFALILLFAAHAAIAGGFPPSAQAAAMSPAGARIHARESAQMNRLMAISAAAVVTAGASAQNAVQWRVEDGGNGHWYQFVRRLTEICWDVAKADAEQRGGYLATVTSAGEHELLVQLCQTSPGIGIESGPWLGGRLGTGQAVGWSWITDEPFRFTAWAAVEPNGGSETPYLHYWRWADLRWNDQYQCARSDLDPAFTYLVEYSADCNADGIVDYGQIRAGELADANANNIPDCCESGPPCDCPGDTNNDGFVDGIDLATILTRWAQPAAKFPNADCNRDGVIDGSDLSIVLGAWGVCP